MRPTKELIQKYYIDQNLKSEDVAKILGISRSCFYKYRDKFGFPVKTQQKYFAKDNFFSEWSREMAYCLGFITADGHVWKDRYFLTIGLSESDIDVLTYIRDQISPDTIVRQNPKGNSIQITLKSQQIWEDLRKYNVTHDKTFGMKIDFDIPEEYWGTYLKGYFDGDGSVWQNRPNYYYVGFVSASRQILDYIQNRLGYGKVRVTHEGKYYCLEISNKHLIDFRNLLYGDNLVIMKRKYDLLQKVELKKDRSWTKEEDQIVLDNINLKSKFLVELLPNRTFYSVKARANYLAKLQQNSQN